MFFRSGFQSASKNFNNADLEVNVNGRAFMITGANSGIGKCAAIAIAQKGKRPYDIIGPNCDQSACVFVYMSVHPILLVQSL